MNPPLYNTIDATLWYFNAVYQYYEHTRDKQFIGSLIPVLMDIIDWHEKGTRYHIHVDPADGLISGGQDGSQLTWMDAKVDQWVVTHAVVSLLRSMPCGITHFAVWTSFR